MSVRRDRTRVARGIFRDSWGFEVEVRVGSAHDTRRKVRRFRSTATLREMRAWQDEVRPQLRKAAGRQAVTRETLEHDVRTYLPRVTSMPSFKARRAELAAWVTLFGDRPTTKLTSGLIATTCEDWAADGVAASTINHRRNALKQLFTALYPDLDNPVVRTRKRREPDLVPREIPPEEVTAIFEAMPDSLTKAQLRLIATTGMSPIRIARARPRDFDERDGSIWLEGRRKGKGTPGRRFPLTQAGLAAWHAFAKWNAWGRPIRSSTMQIVFKRACREVSDQRVEQGGDPLPPYRPYDLRHTFASQAYRLTGDVQAVAALLDCTVETALRYARGAVDDRMRAVVTKLDGGKDSANVAQGAARTRSRVLEQRERREPRTARRRVTSLSGE